MSEQPGQEPFGGMPNDSDLAAQQAADLEAIRDRAAAGGVASASMRSAEDEDAGSEAWQSLGGGQSKRDAAIETAHRAVANAKPPEPIVRPIPGPPAKPVLSEQSQMSAPDPAEGAEQLAEALKAERLKGVPEGNQLHDEARTQAWIDSLDRRHGSEARDRLG